MTSPQSELIAVRRVRTPDLTTADIAQLLDLFHACWPGGDFTTDDIAHAMGGVHFIAEARGRIIGHASVVQRLLEAEGVPLATGYVEAVATHPEWRHRGIASRIMTAASEHIAETFEVGALSTDQHLVYSRVGWERWRGPTFVRADAGPVRTPDEDDGIMILRTPRTPPLSGTESLSCEWRAGDAW